MLSKEDNELITNVEAGTPMGELFRRFWLPVMLADELPGPDSVPVRVRVLGENFIAFRGTDGRVGLLDAYCPHRGAPLFYGRNEEDGLRCVYHGWKFNVDGVCVDLPSAPEGDAYKEKIHIRSYPCLEAGDLIWTYMGPSARRPPFPAFDWLHLPKENRYIRKFVVECNYLQAMEGDYDPIHARFLHSVLEGASPPGPENAKPIIQRARRFDGVSRSPADDPFPRSVGTRRALQKPTAEIDDTESGVITVAAAERGPGEWTASLGVMVMLPIFCTAGSSLPGTYSSNMRVPIDNESLMFFRLRWRYDAIPQDELREYETSGWYYPELIQGTFNTVDNFHNDYNRNYERQRTENYTGIKTLTLQDVAMIEDQWGPIADRNREHLTSYDYIIIHVRQRLLKTAKALADGIEPSEPWHPEAFCHRREEAIAATREEAIAKVKAKALVSGLRKMEIQTE